MDKTLNLKMDGLEASFKEKSQVELVEYLLDKLNFWKDVASTHKKSIDLLYNERMEKK